MRLAVIGAALAMLLQPATAQPDPRAGVDYITLDEQSCLAPAAGKIEVVEVFSYTCIHCYRLQKTLHAWADKLPLTVRLEKMPVVWGEGDEPLARLFWSMQVAKVGSNEAHSRIFTQIHDRRRGFSSEADTLRLANGADLEADKLARIGKSFLVNARIKRSRSLTREWQITGTPSFVVAGRYRVSANRENRLTRPQLLDVVLWLANREVRNGNRDSCAN